VVFYPKQSMLKTMAGAVGAALLLHSPGAYALGLMEAYQAALKNDPTYRAAYYANEGGKENRALGLSSLLPSISGSYTGSQNRTTVAVGAQTQPQDYISRSATIGIRQGVLNLDGIARYKQGAAQTKYAAAQYASQQQEVIMRVTSAYMDVLYKNELLSLAQVERDMYVEQRKVNDHTFQKGEGTRTDMLETQARLDAAEAAVLESQDQLTSSRDTLASVIGGEVGHVDELVPDFQPRPDDGVAFEAWKNIALERNPDIQSMRDGVEIAHQEVNKQRAGHAPRLDFVATYGKNASASIDTVNEDQTIRSIGFELNIPIYSGGQVSASTRQAVAAQEKAKADLQAQIDKIVIELHKDYNSLQSSVARINALLKSVASAELLIKATEQSIKGGARINLDALNAKQQLYTSKRDLAQARFNYLLNVLRLRASVGTLSASDVQEIAPYFR